MEKVCNCGVDVKSIDIYIEDELILFEDGTTESKKTPLDGGGFLTTAYIYCPKCKKGFFLSQKGLGEPDFGTNEVVITSDEIPDIEIVVRKTRRLKSD